MIYSTDFQFIEQERACSYTSYFAESCAVKRYKVIILYLTGGNCDAERPFVIEFPGKRAEIFFLST